MSTICDLCEEHHFRMQYIYKNRIYCAIADVLGPIDGKYRVRDTAEDDVYDETPPYRCLAEEYVPGITPIL